MAGSAGHAARWRPQGVPSAGAAKCLGQVAGAMLSLTCTQKELADVKQGDVRTSIARPAAVQSGALKWWCGRLRSSPQCARGGLGALG